MNEVDKLIEWSRKNAVMYPWTTESSPYRIWISEIMLQQTLVTTVIQRYIQWFERFPDIQTLSEAEEIEVLRVWEGLGYYSRAKNIWKAAQRMIHHFNGQVPNDYQLLRTLPGIGEYTACAILALAFSQVHLVIDANVKRIIQRLLAEELWKKDLEKQAISRWMPYLTEKNIRDFTSAVMQFGQLQCKSQNPLCTDCCLQNNCLAKKKNLVNSIPVKRKSRITKLKTFPLFIIYKDTVLMKPKDKGIGAALWFPLVFSQRADLSKYSGLHDLSPKRHYYTEYCEEMEPHYTFVDESQTCTGYERVMLTNLDSIPVASVYRSLLNELKDKLNEQ